MSEIEAVVLACRRLYAALEAFDAHACDMISISRNDLRCLNLLETGPVPAGRIAASLGLSTGSVTALIDRLERKGLVVRQQDPSDRRSVNVAATPKVYETIGKLYASYAERLRQSVAQCDLPTRTAMTEGLLLAARACEESLEDMRPREQTDRSR